MFLTICISWIYLNNTIEMGVVSVMMYVIIFTLIVCIFYIM